MKIFTFVLLILCLPFIKMEAQNITFSCNNVGFELWDVKVDNLTTGATLSLPGDFTLQLIPATGITDLNINGQDINVFPNPVINNADISFVVPSEGNVVISINDFSGKEILQNSSQLKTGKHTYHIQGLSKGLYVTSVKGRNFEYSVKIISHNKLNGSLTMEHMGYENVQIKSRTKSLKNIRTMPYNSGERLRFTGSLVGGASEVPISKIVKIDIPTSDKNINFEYVSCVDVCGYVYPVVTIGTQMWMAENLRTTKLNNRSPIRKAGSNAAWASVKEPAYCWWLGDSVSNYYAHGALYNFYAGDTNKLCPVGWHVPSYNELDVLRGYVGNAGNWEIGGDKLKETGANFWLSTNNGTNQYGFSAFGSGYRQDNGGFGNIHVNAFIWTSTETSDSTAWFFFLYVEDSIIWSKSDLNKGYGATIRCLKD